MVVGLTPNSFAISLVVCISWYIPITFSWSSDAVLMEVNIPYFFKALFIVVRWQENCSLSAFMVSPFRYPWTIASVSSEVSCLQGFLTLLAFVSPNSSIAVLQSLLFSDMILADKAIGFSAMEIFSCKTAWYFFELCLDSCTKEPLNLNGSRAFLYFSEQ